MILAEPTRSSAASIDSPREIFGFEVIDFIGEGAGSLIYVVSHPDTHQLYALKHVRRRAEKDIRFFEQIENEFEVSRRFSHPALRRSIDLRDNRTLFRKPTEAALIMELFDGAPLDSHRPSDPASALACFIQVAQGLASLHSLGYAHCDLKPNNILINTYGQIKLIDFGQTCPLGWVKERIQGTPDFIAPEQVRREPITERTDIFNLGATFYWTLAGRSIPTLYTLKKSPNSFLLDDSIPSPTNINPHIPQVLSNLVMDCIRTNPSKRPPTMPDLLRRLEIVQHALSRQMAVA